MTRIFIYILLTVYPIISLKSQSPGNLGVLSRSYGDSIVLRLITTDYNYLNEIFVNGYNIKRQEIDFQNLKKIGELESINSRKIVLGEQLSLASLKQSKYFDLLSTINENRDLFNQTITEENSNQISIFQQGLEMATNVICATDIQAAKYLGLRFTDSSVESGKSYIYYVSIKDPLLDTMIVLNTVVVNNEYEKLPDISLFEVESTFEKVTIKWGRELNNNTYFVYDIERSADNNNFSKINNYPILPMYDEEISAEHSYFIDSVENYKPYDYRVIGWTYFGERGPEIASKPGMGIDDIAPENPSLIYLDQLENEGVVIQWVCEDSYDDIEYYDILKSNNLNENYQSILESRLSNTTKKYLDDLPITTFKNYYKVCAIDTAGNRSCSAPKRLLMQDISPPETPIIVESKIDSNGVVTLQWESNREDDLWGYYVYRTNDHNTNFLRVTNHPHLSTEFRDTISINTLTNSVHYAVAAIDVRANVSKFTDTISLIRPDKIAPSPAMFISGTNTDEGNVLVWVPSPFRDVVRQELYKLESASNNWVLVQTLKPFVNSFTVEFEEFKKTKYKLITIDKSNNKTESANTVSVNYKTPTSRPKPENLIVKKTMKGAFLNWELDAETTKLIIYKSIENPDQFFKYRILECSSCSEWTDEKVGESDTFYKIQLKTIEGAYTEISNTVKYEK